MGLPKKRIVSLDLLRGLSVLYIVGFWHMFNYTQCFPQYYNFITLRLTLIILASYTFLSGYFIGLKDVILTSKSIKNFLLNRIMRIYPLYILAIVVFYS